MKPNVDKLAEMYRFADKLDIRFRHDDTLFIETNGARSPLALQIPDSEIIHIRKKMGGYASFIPSICNAARSIMSIGPDGAVFPCGAFTCEAGNIRETPLERIWYDAPIMKKLRTLDADDYEVCRKCRYVVRCNGCMAMGIGLASGRTVPCRFARKHLRNLT